MSLMNFISPALTAGTEAAAANVEGKQQGSALLRQIMMQNASLQKTEAEDAKARAETFLAQRHANVPMLGDAGYNAAVGGEAGAKVAGETPGLVAREGAMGAPKAANAAAEVTATAKPKANAARLQAIALLPVEVQKLVTAGKISLENAQAEQKQRAADAANLQHTGQEGSFLNTMGEKQAVQNSGFMGKILSPFRSAIPSFTPEQVPSNQIGQPTPPKKVKTGNIFLDGQDE